MDGGKQDEGQFTQEIAPEWMDQNMFILPADGTEPDQTRILRGNKSTEV